jgi:alpha-glucosidase (family GH31 glycosyl hydrolase)
MSMLCRIVGGMLDLFWVMGPTLEEAVQQYTAMVGRPAMPPAWALGFHQSRWGYRSVSDLDDVVSGYQAANIPLDTIWSDLDHMDGFRDFTLQPERYTEPDMTAFLQHLHARGRRWVPIVDPGIAMDTGYPAYDDGIDREVFIKDVGGNNYVGQVQRSASHAGWLMGSFLCASSDLIHTLASRSAWHPCTNSDKQCAQSVVRSVVQLTVQWTCRCGLVQCTTQTS